ncbi:tRNA pseudouridine(55) synthase TruB [Microbacterium sp. P05]|uniref:tRNA pseudouridine(55) synthase TruB n=1 Tax=Microbacterium sp. P05 TaxID=3366948 RepID=UPI0037457AC1
MPAGGMLLVDKPAGITSHDVVSRARKARNTRKIGHAGTLDPMATGLLVLGVDAATRLLTFIVGADKTYTATLALGATTDTDDADGEIVERAAPERVDAVDDALIDAGIAALTGEISQVPTTVSAIKVNGRRAYDLARAGVEVQLASRDVVVSRFEVVERRRVNEMIELDVTVDVSSGTYVRALARDLGEALGIGGHLTALRRTRIGPFSVTDAVTLDGLAAAPLLSPAEVGTIVLGALHVTEVEAADLREGRRLLGAATRLATPRAAAIDPDGVMIGVVERRGKDVKSVMNLPTGAAA